jgi:aspartate ammonia-lyase
VPPSPDNRPVRVERDALGTLAIPADALYGIQTARACTNLSFSAHRLGACPPCVRAFGAVKRAVTRANGAADVIDARVAAAIEAATAPLLAGELLEHFPADLLGGGGAIGVHMNVNEVIANVANEQLGARRGDYAPVHPLRHVSASQSTADVCHTALRLAILWQWPALERGLQSTADTLQEKAVAFAAVPTLARTCLQDALPTSAGLLFQGHRALVRRRTDELARAVDTLHAVPLGGTVIGTGEGAPPRYRERVIPLLNEVTGMSFVPRAELPDALQNGDDLRAVSAQLAMLAEALIKIAQDLRLLGSGPHGGFGEIILPYVQQGSSFFSDKRNPVVPETVLNCAFQVLGCERAVQAALQQAELQLNVFDTFVAVNVLDAIDMLTNAVDRFETHCLRGLEVDAARCRELAELGQRR